MRLFALSILLGALLASQSWSQEAYPKREFRGAWVAVVTNLDWPSSPHLTTAQQKAELEELFDDLKDAGVNAVYFHIRTECDAVYASSIEPWSYWLTGQQGSAPSPLYDPLEFAIDEARKRGMELHAWFNPYRAVKSVGYYTNSASHVSNAHTDWVLERDNYKFLDPGLPAVEDYIVSVFMDVVERYDVDGVHMDDYFYPYGGMGDEDAATFAAYPRGFTDVGDWRRDNVNRLIARLQDTIAQTKPHIKFGVSPFGIWKPGTPSGISGMDAYNTIYCDPMAWLEDRSVDYLTPQLYWGFGGGQDYGTLMPWWADQCAAHNRHLYPGMAAYKLVAPNVYSGGELPSQVRANRREPDCQGGVFFEAANFQQNPKGFTDSLRYRVYSVPAIPPEMDWKTGTTPNAPSNLRFETGTEGEYLTWDPPAPSGDGDTTLMFAVYRFDHAPTEAELDEGNNLFGVGGWDMKLLPARSSFANNPTGDYYVVTSVGRYSAESAPSAAVQYDGLAATTPSLSSPATDHATGDATVTLAWVDQSDAQAYSIEIAEDAGFTTMTQSLYGYDGATVEFGPLEIGVTYHWRVKAHNYEGESGWSEVRTFRNGLPVAPTLASPAHASTVGSMEPTLTWNADATKIEYGVEIGTNISMGPTQIIHDTLVAGESVTLSGLGLDPQTPYFWRVKTRNAYGWSEWSEVWGFLTPEASDVRTLGGLPEEYAIFQNYPNPFNPTTTLRFALPEAAHVKLSIYNALGERVAAPIDRRMNAGFHETSFDASGLAGGVYYYRIEAGEFADVEKMILLK
jgi:uncharacterized lipoprotein YddW (UPF0748 family)